MGFTFNEFPWSKFYDSDLREVLKYMREFETKLDSYDETITELQEALNNISDLYTRVDDLESAISDLATIRTDISTLKGNVSDLTNMDSALQEQINSININLDSINTKFTTVYEYIDTEISKVNIQWYAKYLQLQTIMNIQYSELKEMISELSSRIDEIDTSVINPWHDLLGRISIQRNNNYIYNELADEIVTAEEYSKLGYTATEYQSLDISAHDYCEFGKKKLHFYWVYSPTFGWRQEINNVLTSIVNEVMDTLTADEYTALDLDAEDYYQLDITAFEYYSFNTDRGYLKLGGNGITAQQYSTITT